MELFTEGLLKGAVIVVGLLTLFGVLVKSGLSFTVEGRKVRVSRMEFLLKLINEHKWKHRDNRVLVEQAFSSIYGQLTFTEINCLTNATNPDEAIRCYRRYHAALKVESNLNKVTIIDKFYSGFGVNVSRYSMRLVFVGVTSLLIGTMFFVEAKPHFYDQDYVSGIFCVVFTFVFGFLSAWSYVRFLIYIGYKADVEEKLADVLHIADE